MLWKRMIYKISFVKDPLGQTHYRLFFKTCFNDHKLYNLYQAKVSSTSHRKSKTTKQKANKRSMYRIKDKVPFESLLSVLTDIQAGKKLILWGRK